MVAHRNPTWFGWARAGYHGLACSEPEWVFQLVLFHRRTIRVHSSPRESRPGPVRAGPGSAHGIINFAHAYPARAQGRICMGSSGLPVPAPIKSLCKPSQIPYVAQTGLGPGRMSLSAQIPHGPGTARLAIWDCRRACRQMHGDLFCPPPQSR